MIQGHFSTHDTQESPAAHVLQSVLPIHMSIMLVNAHMSIMLVNVYACRVKINAKDWQFLHKVATIEKNVILCGDYNAKDRLWSNTHTSKQGDELEDALV